MVHLVLPALFGAGVAHVGALQAQRCCEAAAAGHEGCGGAADLGAIHIQGDTVRHHLYIVFLQAGGAAVVAGGRASVAGLDAGFDLVF